MCVCVCGRGQGVMLDFLESGFESNAVAYIFNPNTGQPALHKDTYIVSNNLLVSTLLHDYHCLVDRNKFTLAGHFINTFLFYDSVR